MEETTGRIGAAPGPARVFLSYARDDDEPFVRRLYADLTAAGFVVWFDRESLLSRGLTFLQEIKDAIRNEVDRIVYVGGPKAALSPYVREEWQFGLECDTVVVTPIRRIGDMENIPGELSLLHCEDFRDDGAYPAALAKLMESLRQPNPKLGALFAVPGLPANFLGRPELMRRVRDALLVDLQTAQVITSANARVGMQGMGGIGKSVLAAVLARNRQVRAAYPDGIVWISCGQHLTRDDLVARMRDAARHFGGDTNFGSIPQGQGVLRELLHSKAVMLVLDDVWQAGDAQAFDVLGPRSRMLATTRDAGILHALHGEHVPVSLFTEDEALQLLADAVGLPRGALPPEALDVARECGHLPLALALSGGMAAKRGGDFRHVLDRLRRADLDKIADRNAINPQHESIWRAMQASVDMLDGDEQRRFAELAAFDTDTTVTEAAVATLWEHTGGLNALDTEDLLINLSERSLIQITIKTDDTGNRQCRVSLHDLLHDYAVRIAGEPGALHLKMVEAYRAKCPDGWASGPNDGYFLENLCTHLVRMEGWDMLLGNADQPGVLTDLLFIQAKCKAGLVHDLVADYNAVLVALPEFREENERNRRYAEAMFHYNDALRNYAVRHYAWFQQKEQGHTTPEPEYPSMPLELQEKGKVTLPEEHSERAARLRHFANFVSGNMSLLSKFPEYTLPCGCNWSEGPVAIHAEQRIQKATLPWLKRSPRPPAQPLRPQCLLTLRGHTSMVTSVCVSPDGKRALSGSWDHTLRLWDLDSGQCLSTLQGHTSGVTSVCFSPDGKRAISGSDDKTLRLWGLDSGQCLSTLRGDTDRVTSVCFSPDGKRALSGSWDETPRLWDLDSGVCLNTLEEHTDKVTSVCFSPDGKRALSGSGDTTLRLWDLDSGQSLHILQGHSYRVTSVCFSPDGKRAISGSDDETLCLWDLDSGQCLSTLRGDADRVTSVCVSPDGKRALSGCWDTTLRLWDLDSGECINTLEGHTAWVASVCFSPDGKRALSGSGDKTLGLWDLDSGQCISTLEGHTSPILSMCISPVGKRALSVCWDSTLRLWDLDSGQCLSTLDGYSGSNSVCLSPDGKRALSGSGDNTLRLWGLDSGQCLSTLVGHTDCVASLCISPNGKRALSASWDSTLRLWDLDSGQCLNILEGHTGAVTSVCFSQDGKHALSGSGDYALRLWDLDSGQCLSTLQGHTKGIYSLCFSPDGKHALSGSGDKTFRLWDLDSGQCIAFYHAGNSVGSVAITADGGRIVCGTSDGQMHFLTPVNIRV